MFVYGCLVAFYIFVVQRYHAMISSCVEYKRNCSPDSHHNYVYLCAQICSIEVKCWHISVIKCSTEQHTDMYFA